MMSKTLLKCQIRHDANQMEKEKKSFIIFEPRVTQMKLNGGRIRTKRECIFAQHMWNVLLVVPTWLAFKNVPDKVLEEGN